MIELGRAPNRRFTKPRDTIFFLSAGQKSFTPANHGGFTVRTASKMMRKNYRFRVSLADFFNPA
jgi:hypothetical protein